MERGGGCFPLFTLPGLDPGILFASTIGMPSGFCYIMTNRPRGVLYVGSTANLPRRAYEHRMGLLDGFTSKYGLTQLVHYEEYAMYMDAVQRERTIKHWSRAWKIALVEKNNPEWTDLYGQLA
jgi:putative endonuclease